VRRDLICGKPSGPARGLIFQALVFAGDLGVVVDGNIGMAKVLAVTAVRVAVPKSGLFCDGLPCAMAVCT